MLSKNYSRSSVIWLHSVNGVGAMYVKSMIDKDHKKNILPTVVQYVHTLPNIVHTRT